MFEPSEKLKDHFITNIGLTSMRKKHVIFVKLSIKENVQYVRKKYNFRIK